MVKISLSRRGWTRRERARRLGAMADALAPTTATTHRALWRAPLLVDPADAPACAAGLAQAYGPPVFDLAEGGALRAAAGGLDLARAQAARMIALADDCLVRVNALASGLVDDDLAALAQARPAAVLAPDCVSGADAQHLSAKLAVHEALAGAPDGAIGLVCCLSRAAALLRLASWRGASARLRALTWDPRALARDLGLPALREGGALTPPLAQARAMLLFAAADAGVRALDAPYDGPAGDMEAVAREAHAARRDGFAGKFARDLDEAREIARVFATR